MDRKEGIEVLSRGAWLRRTPAKFRSAILSRCRWERLEAGALIQVADERDGDMSGLARGIIKLRAILGCADTPIMHLARPVFWIGYGPIISRHRPRRVEATAKTTVWLARVSQAEVRKLLIERRPLF
jgi:CRP/FNR family transcriptional regulator, cyclic AMP receptor protein